MNRNLVAQFVLRLQDRASAGLAALQRRVQALGAAARTVALLGGALAGLSVAGPVREAAALERTMRQTAITAGLSGAAVEEMMGRNLAMFQRVARETNVRVIELAGAASTLVAGGGEAGAVWEQLVPIIGRVAQASGANAGDLAQSVLAMVNNLRLGPDQVEQALASMVQAGKEGQFELRDMAREFAGLTAAAAGIGLTGPRAVHSLAAALQVARQGAGSAGEAATNLTNILQKMTSPDAVRNFRDMGVDLEAVLKNAAERGINPFEAIVQKIRQVTGGDMFRVSELFADSQVLAFLRPMLQQTERYLEVRDRAAAASPRIIREDAATAARGLDAALRRLTVAWDEFTGRVGTASEGPIRVLGDVFMWLSEQVLALEERFPELLGTVGMAAGGLLALSGVLGLAGMAAGPLAAGLGLVGRALLALLTPFGLVLTAATLAALYIWREWDRFRGDFEGLAAGMETIARGLVEFLAGVFTLDMGRAAEGLTTIWGGVQGFFENLWSIIRRLFEDFATWLDGWTGGAVTAAVERFRAAFDGLSEWFSGLWARIRAPFDGFVTGVTSAIERIQALWDNVSSRFGAGQAAAAGAAPPAMGNVQARQAAAAAGRADAFYGPGAAAAAAGVAAPAARPSQPVTGEITVRAAPGTEIVSTQSGNRDVPITPDRGATRARQ